jgi:hypothetical protein
MGGNSEDSDAASGVLDNGEDVDSRSAGRCRGEEVAREDRLGLAAEKVAQVWRSRSGAGSIPCFLRISHTVEGATVLPRMVSSPWMRR